jgi:hypothetical protein
MESESPLFYCEKCNYKTTIIGCYKQHLKTTLHITGKRKERKDKNIFECKHCNDYKNNNHINFMNHVLTNHATKEERKKGYRYYCDVCDVGSFVEAVIKKHNNSKKHDLKIHPEKIFENL